MFKKIYSPDKVDPFEMPTETQLPNGGYSPNTERSQLKAYSELVDHPAHYNQGKIEAIDAILDWGLDFIEGNVVKYVVRSRHKSSRLGDLKKARWYLDYLIDKLEKEKK
jgi:hypothetical protein